MEEYNRTIDQMSREEILSKLLASFEDQYKINKSIIEEQKQLQQQFTSELQKLRELIIESQADSTGDDTDEDEDLTVFNDSAGEAYSQDDAVVESNPVPADSKSTSELGKCAIMEKQLKLVNQKSAVYEVQNDAPELFDECPKKDELRVAAIEADTALIIAAITDNIPNLPTHPNSLQFNPAYSVVKQYFVDVDDIVPQKVIVHKDLIQDGVSDELLALDLGKQVHTCVISNKVEFDYMLGSALMNMYGKCSDIDGVKYAYCLLNVDEQYVLIFDPGGGVLDCNTSHRAVKFAELLTKIDRRSDKELEKEHKFLRNGESKLLKNGGGAALVHWSTFGLIFDPGGSTIFLVLGSRLFLRLHRKRRLHKLQELATQLIDLCAEFQALGKTAGIQLLRFMTTSVFSGRMVSVRAVHGAAVDKRPTNWTTICLKD